MKARTLKQIRNMPQGKMAHSVIYIPPEREFKRVAQYLEGVKGESHFFCDDEYGDMVYKCMHESDEGTLYCFGGISEKGLNSPSGLRYNPL